MNFIQDFSIQDKTLCDEIIDYHKQSENKWHGIIGKGFDQSIKKSIDVHVQTDLLVDHPLFSRYCEELNLATKKYYEKYEYLNMTSRWGIVENLNIQYYKPGDAFFKFHTERTTGKFPASVRHLVFMTYLNDVFEGGGTEFYYQKSCYLARKGTTLIWPVDWTHVHRGVPAPKEEKYIITGWFSFTDFQD